MVSHTADPSDSLLISPHLTGCHRYRILYRLISGIHTSIGIHIARDYKHDLEDDDSWGPAPQLFWERYGNTQQRTRLTNLYFVFSFVHRAISKGAETILQTIQTTEGNRESSRQAQNRTTLALLRPFFQALRDHPSCVSPFNEGVHMSLVDSHGWDITRVYMLFRLTRLLLSYPG